MKLEYKIFPISDTALTIEFENKIDIELNQFILYLSQSIDNQSFTGYIENIPAYCTLSILYCPNIQFRYSDIKVWIDEFIKNFIWEPQNSKQNLIEIPTIYDGEDLDFVANFCNISTNELIKIHSETTYRVFMMGFLPGFTYLGGMNERISVPRRETPRMKVPAGSIGIAGNQTGIYPIESPGGWQLIGRTELKLFDKNATSPTLLKAGDLVKFCPL